MGYRRNNIDHSFYNKRDQHNNLFAILSITANDLLLSCSNVQVEFFYDKLSAAFDITTPTDTTKLKFLNLAIF